MTQAELLELLAQAKAEGWTTLDLTGMELEVLPPEIAQLQNLSRLDLSENQFGSLPPEIAQLQNLSRLDLRGNQLSSLPEYLQDFPKLKTLDLRGNPLPIPPEILGPREFWQSLGDCQTILQFYFNSQRESKRLYEAKLILVGDGTAGKTSLANKLKTPDYKLPSPNEWEWTRGIDILPWEIQHPNDHPYRVNIWDFGGQHIYHTTHQFFLSERSVYVLVHDNRKGQTDFQYWLESIQLLGRGSPIIIVKNEKDDCPAHLDESAFQIPEGVPNLTVRSTNLKTDQDFDKVRAAIEHSLCRDLQHIGEPLPVHWAKMRAVLENLSGSRNYLENSEYLQLCEENGFGDKKEMSAASQFFHDLGICLHFQRETLLNRLIILNPTWATDAIYKIFDDKTVEKNCGRFDKQTLETLWNQGDTAEKRPELLELMKKFELCYEIPDKRGSYMVPTLLASNPPEYEWDSHDNLILQYYYPFKPKKLFPSFIVDRHERIEQQTLVWRHGVVLTDGRTRAEVIEDREYRRATITIRVSGADKRGFLQIVAARLEEIQNRYGDAKQFNYETRIPCNCRLCQPSQEPNFYTWEDLERRLTRQKYEFECRLSLEGVDVRSLISNIVPHPVGARTVPEPNYPESERRSSLFSPTVNVNYHHPNATMSNTTNNNLNNYGDGDQFVGDKVGRDKIGTQHINVSQEVQQVAQEIQAIIIQESDGYDLKSEKGQRKAAEDSVEVIKADPKLSDRFKAALKSGGETAIKEIIDHPIAHVVVDATKGFMKGE
ncbi:COR domain-containing protein [Sodalinema gerasimenkoae]|uniref:COR domain-containing protein n=1 Tax=Sodalinema gerasimenkoae TaxID=2862348 RepID=UPI00135A0740|nr:COR domain-containing protein [Sodalinema gerasimenkoae]